MTALHNHGAAVSGAKAEILMRKAATNAGYDILKIKSDYEQAGIDPMGKRYFRKPEWYPTILKETSKAKESFYESDGFIQAKNTGIILELKNSNKHGTTEEKVFYDLEKIRDGVYGTEHELWYIFAGNVAENTGVYKLFESKAKKEKLPVRIIWGFEELERALKEL
jgi:hypothetical protein